MSVVLDPVGHENTVTETEMRDYASRGMVTSTDVMQTPDGEYFVVLTLYGHRKKEWYLTTRRERTRPRMFQNLEKLNMLLCEIVDHPTLTIHRGVSVPAAAGDGN